MKRKKGREGRKGIRAERRKVREVKGELVWKRREKRRDRKGGEREVKD